MSETSPLTRCRSKTVRVARSRSDQSIRAPRKRLRIICVQKLTAPECAASSGTGRDDFDRAILCGLLDQSPRGRLKHRVALLVAAQLAGLLQSSPQVLADFFLEGNPKLTRD